MYLDAKCSTWGLVNLWNPLEVVFQDWMINPRIFIGRFCYVGMKELAFLTTVYGPSMTRDKLYFLEKILAT